MDSAWWTMSPSYFSNTVSLFFTVLPDGRVGFDEYGSRAGKVRPSISLKSSVKVSKGGDGTVNNPYEFVIN